MIIEINMLCTIGTLVAKAALLLLLITTICLWVSYMCVAKKYKKIVQKNKEAEALKVSEQEMVLVGKELDKATSLMLHSLEYLCLDHMKKGFRTEATGSGELKDLFNKEFLWKSSEIKLAIRYTSGEKISTERLTALLNKMEQLGVIWKSTIKQEGVEFYTLGKNAKLKGGKLYV